MSSEKTEDAKKTENIVNSFGNVIKMYEETAFLLEDFAKIFGCKMMLREGKNTNTVQAYTSNSIKLPDEWLPIFAGWDFWPKGQKEGNSGIAVMAVFPFPSRDPRDAVPYLVVGVIGKSLYDVLSLHQHFIHNKEKFLGKGGLGKDGKEKEVDLKNGEIFKVLPLLKVRNKSVVKELADWVQDRITRAPPPSLPISRE
ncbi:MAG: hypothetical protein MPK11_05475 [Gammaproteobacteria bacterium]|nr:hypothetical protein [Gammaproteobacteria bacterium]MDA7970206.1 hypothetical protein [Gammaproteobacteria bacterium]MDA8023732.1 hypothetical protein [Gammaproteobacteria bacterium]CAJ2376229.1 MAG: hypothetical protein IBGAMO2_250003 [Arenicellales bacterium IbO2]